MRHSKLRNKPCVCGSNVKYKHCCYLQPKIKVCFKGVFWVKPKVPITKQLQRVKTRYTYQYSVYSSTLCGMHNWLDNLSTADFNGIRGYRHFMYI